MTRDGCDSFEGRESWYEIQYGAHGLQGGDFYEAKGGEARPLVVMFHGGGWVSGDKRQGHYQVMQEALCELGFSSVSLNYRLAPEVPFPGAVEDGLMFLEGLEEGRWEFLRPWRMSVHEQGYERGQVVLFGSSAGACIALLVAQWWRKDGIAGVMSLAAPTEFRASEGQKFSQEVEDEALGAWLGGSPAALPEVARRASPCVGVREGLPRHLLMHAVEDARVDVVFSRVFGRELAAVGVEHELVEFAGVEAPAHGLASCWEEAWPVMRSFLENFLNKG